MIDTGRFQSCVCIGRNNPNNLCEAPLTFQEKGVKVTLSLRNNEEAQAIVLDGCVCIDNKKKCDGLFLFKRSNNRKIILVELKGTHLDDAFEQISLTKQRAEYQELVQLFSENGNHRVSPSAFIISSTIFKRHEIAALENQHNIRVKVLYCGPTSKIPDIRPELR